jgi:hypothetical protein
LIIPAKNLIAAPNWARWCGLGAAKPVAFTADWCRSPATAEKYLLLTTHAVEMVIGTEVVSRRYYLVAHVLEPDAPVAVAFLPCGSAAAICHRRGTCPIQGADAVASGQCLRANRLWGRSWGCLWAESVEGATAKPDTPQARLVRSAAFLAPRWSAWEAILGGLGR